MKITQKKLNYTFDAAQPSSATYDDAEDPVYAKINFARDLSALNRVHIEQTTRKGVPYVYGVRVNATGSRIDKGAGTPDELVSDDAVANSTVTLRFYGTLNNWVYRNAAVKTHAARENMFKKPLVPEMARGAYSRSVHYALESGSESYLDPVATTSRTSINGGDWEITQLIYPDDAGGAFLTLTGAHGDEETTTAHTDLCLPQLYLSSRHAEMEADTNVESATHQAKHSVLNKLLTEDYGGTRDEIVALARDEQDAPPYQLSDTGDWTNLVEIGRIQFNPYTGGTASTFIEVPFGVMKMQGQILDHSDDDADWSLDLSFDVKTVGVMQ